MSRDKINSNEYWDGQGNLQIKGEKEGTRRINKVDVPFYSIYVCDATVEERSQRPTVTVTVKRNVSSKDEKTNSVFKKLDKITNLTHCAEVLVRLRRQLEVEIYPMDNPPCGHYTKVQGRLSNFETCLEETARDAFREIVAQSQLDTLEQFEKTDLPGTKKAWEERNDEFFYHEWLLALGHDDPQVKLSIFFYERLVWHRVNLMAFKDVTQSVSDFETYLTQRIAKPPQWSMQNYMNS